MSFYLDTIQQAAPIARDLSATAELTTGRVYRVKRYPTHNTGLKGPLWGVCEYAANGQILGMVYRAERVLQHGFAFAVKQGWIEPNRAFESEGLANG